MAAVQQLSTPKTATSVHNDAMDVDPNATAAVPAATAILVQTASSTSTPTLDHATSSKFGSGPQKGDTRIVVIIYGHDQAAIVSVFAEVLGKPYCTRPSFASIAFEDRGRVIGIKAKNAKADIASRQRDIVVAINAHPVSVGMPPDTLLSSECDYEFLYTSTPLFRRDLSRFISFTLNQINHHETLMALPRTFFISTTFPDVRAALPNIDILTVGCDAVEIRVDLLKEPLGGGRFAPVPSLSYVGEQVMLLRQHTELPIIFTTRCTRENGRFPMEDPELFYEYLTRAIQWGVEYIDVELWLPERIRKSIYEHRGNSRILGAFHDFSGLFKWSSAQAQAIFAKSCHYSDIIKMIATISDRNENFELEYFRSKMRTEYPEAPPLSAMNMGELGQFSRTQNHVFTPITHPLLPVIAAPGQMSAAELNMALSLLGQLPKKNIYGIVTPSSRIGTPQAPFYEKCFNELGLPHNFAVVERQPKLSSSIEGWCNQKHFGGAYLNPPVSCSGLISKSTFFSSLDDGMGPVLSESARAIGIVDTIIVRPAPSSPNSAEASEPASPYHYQSDSLGTGTGFGGGKGILPPSTDLIFDNASWRGILRTLTRDLAPSAYFDRTAVVLASASDDAASAIFALKALRISKIYTVGFKTPAALASDLTIEPFNSLESLQRARTVGAHDDFASPFVVISALSPEKGTLVGLLLRIFGSNTSGQVPDTTNTTSHRSNTRKVFLDLAPDGSSARRKGDPGVVAEQSGFAVYGSADTAAFTTVETLKLLVGQNVPYNFVQLAGGRGPF
ncbi:dehydroquinase class 1 [Grosmannia clavigera kw1407]|uniref:Dehydroquinase class 1 n=1 Tax=Grosmannia clavigera (strain kw1407 / UAMH 11150) TaxID=655863 RepID=F0XI13_GROCL|nr:dehydroquinase class 1 [Grosmannia clavigera kw1407]EFX03277.1 dehydroquinase class 1 [Grosmannia clavigera kw1407]